MELVKKILGSFSTGPDGFSARKLTAFVLVCCIVVTHIIWWIKYPIDKLMVEVILCDFTMIAALFGLTTFEPQRKIDSNAEQK